MTDALLARSWNEVRQEFEADGLPYKTAETRSPRKFFAVDEMTSYVIRVRESGGIGVFTLTNAPARSASVASG